METNWRKPKFLRKSKRTLVRVGHVGINLIVALALVVLSYAPLFSNLPGPLGEKLSPKSAEAKNLEWGDVRPPLTNEADTVDDGGFKHLPDFGNVRHAIVVAPNGDIFTAGTGADVNADGTAGCGGANDADWNANAVCDAAAASPPAVYKSVDGGMKWRAINLPATLVGAAIRQIAVSPDWPSDDFVVVVFNNDVLTADAGALATNGICWSEDSGLTFPAANCRTGADHGVDVDLDDVIWTTVALSPDFNLNDGTGELAMGGTWVETSGTAGTVVVSQAAALKAALVAGTFTDIGETTAASADSTTDVTLSLAYTSDEEPIALARVFVANGANTFGQVRTLAAWGATTAAVVDELLDDNTTSFGATAGTVAFDDQYSTGGSYFASAGVAGGVVGGVFRNSGAAWTEKTFVPAGGEPCDTAIESISVAGNGSSTKIVASLNGSNLVCKSTNEGAAWSDTNADGGDSVCDECRVDKVNAFTRIANNRAHPEIVYWTSSGSRGGVSRSTSTGSSWLDTGLTNGAFVVGASDEVDANRAFITATVPAGQDNAGQDALFWTGTYGTGAGWTRVVRTSRTDLVFGGSTGFAVSGVAYSYFSAATTDPIIKTSDAGASWDTTSADPFENSPETNELSVAFSARSSTTVYVGGDKGSVSFTTDSGATWTILAKDFGDRIDEFDFSSDAKTFFVTALDSDTTLKIWQTKDTGATFTKMGDTPWGTGDGLITTIITGYVPADNSGYLFTQTGTRSGVSTSTQEAYRMKMGDSGWTDMDLDTEWDSALMTASANQGDGTLLTLWDNDATLANPLQQTYYPFTGSKEDYDQTQGAANERKNPLVVLPPPPAYFATTTMGTAVTLPGYTLQAIAANRMMELTLSTQFLGSIKPIQPPNGGTVITNTTSDGVPVIFRWEDIDRADAYDVLVGLDPKLRDGVFVNLGAITTTVTEVGSVVKALIPGQTYYWAVRVSSTTGVAGLEGNWSPIWKFSATPASTAVSRSPELLLPIEGTTTGSLGPISVAWNNPPGTTQYHIDFRPLGDDGPGIGLIISDPAIVGSASYTLKAPVFGTGNYVLLPGATYTWRVRTSGSAESISVGHPSWGPWSGVRTFKTPRPNAGTIQLVSPINGAVVTTKKPSMLWKDANSQMFYYEVQVSVDPDFGGGARGPFAAVQYQLVHAGESNPPSSYASPFDLAAGTYYWRVRQRVQATPLGPDEPGIAWTPNQSFKVQ